MIAVEGHVSTAVLNMMREINVSVIANVGIEGLNSLARCTKTVVMQSTNYLESFKLGSCKAMFTL